MTTKKVEEDLTKAPDPVKEAVAGMEKAMAGMRGKPVERRVLSSGELELAKAKLSVLCDELGFEWAIAKTCKAIGGESKDVKFEPALLMCGPDFDKMGDNQLGKLEACRGRCLEAAMFCHKHFSTLVSREMLVYVPMVELRMMEAENTELKAKLAELTGDPLVPGDAISKEEVAPESNTDLA